MLQKEIVSLISDSEILTSEQQGRFWEIWNRLNYLILIGKLKWENLEGRVIDLGTGSGVGLVALETLGATQVVGVEDGSRLEKSLDRIHNILINPFEAFSPAPALQSQIFEMTNEQFLEDARERGWKINLITCFWIGYEPPMRQIEEVLAPDGQVIITAAEDCYSILKKVPGKTKLETEIFRIPGEVVDRPVNDDLVLIGTKRN